MRKKRIWHAESAADAEVESGDSVSLRGSDAPEPKTEEPAEVPGDRLAQLEAECARLAEERLRVEAELANYRRRAIRDREEAEVRAREQVLGEFMALADDLERALDAAEQQEKAGPIFEGVRMVHERVRDILGSHGIEVIDPRGKPFDPHEAEALMEVVSSDFEPGIVVDVIEKGYRQGSKLLRPAKVTVARGES